MAVARLLVRFRDLELAAHPVLGWYLLVLMSPGFPAMLVVDALPDSVILGAE